MGSKKEVAKREYACKIMKGLVKDFFFKLKMLISSYRRIKGEQRS